MKRGETLSATARAERSREATKAAIARELLYASILARLWPAYLCEVHGINEDFPYLLCVQAPSGDRLTWRLSPEEYTAFEWLGPVHSNSGERAKDRTDVLLALATDGSWVDP